MKIGVYVGSFNPVHNGHINLVNKLLYKNIIDRVIIIPTGNYWDKDKLIDIKHRVRMLKDYENDSISINSSFFNTPYTYLILRKLSKVYKNDTLYLIMGSDNLDNLDKWNHYKEILKYNIIVVRRGNVNNLDILKNSKYYLSDFLGDDISSTFIRNSIRNNIYNLSEYVSYNNIKYIRDNNLYI